MDDGIEAPSEATQNLEMRSTLPANGLEPISSIAQVTQNMRRYCDGAMLHPKRACAVSVATTYWVYDPNTGLLAPSKFVGMRDMTFARYEQLTSDPSTHRKFDGGVTHRALASLLGEFTESDTLRMMLTRRLGSEVCASIDTEKWRFALMPSSRRYFALMCNPDRYDGLAAVTALREISWIANRMDPDVGDGVVLWQAKGSGDRRGVIAVGEVTRGVAHESCPPDAAQFWRRAEGAAVQPRLRFRCYESPGLPLWEHAGNEWLGGLAVAKSQGTVFSVEPEQWHHILDLAGVSAVHGDSMEPQMQGGQGIGLSAEERRLVELHAQNLVEQHLSLAGYEVEDVSKDHPYDLRCRRDGEELHVEVKGTTGSGDEVFLTANEVKHARQYRPQMMLAIVSRIRLRRMTANDLPEVEGGDLAVWHPWDVEAGRLVPTQFRYGPP